MARKKTNCPRWPLRVSIFVAAAGCVTLLIRTNPQSRGLDVRTPPFLAKEEVVPLSGFDKFAPEAAIPIANVAPSHPQPLGAASSVAVAATHPFTHAAEPIQENGEVGLTTESEIFEDEGDKPDNLVELGKGAVETEQSNAEEIEQPEVGSSDTESLAGDSSEAGDLTDADEEELRNATKQEKCMGPSRPEPMAVREAQELRATLKKVATEWGYFFEHQHQWVALKGRRVLDVGMGQGPICVVAIAKGVASYTGLDPALCIDKPAKTRNKRVKRTPSIAQCNQTKTLSKCKGLGEDCPAYISCAKKLESKYQTFPYSGVEMMRAYEGRIVLLPGTFETLKGSGLLKLGMFDVATLWSVTEHLPDNHLVLRGIFEWLQPGKYLLISHHNYYGYDGHHGVPRTPADFVPTNPLHKETGQWKHLDPKSKSVYEKESLNRVRLGDLMALVNVYFHCSSKLMATKGAPAALTEPILAPLKRRGFVAAELLISRWNAACVRRKERLEADWLASAKFYHPPVDGSYKAQPLPDYMIREVGKGKLKFSATPKELRSVARLVPAP